jgi:hypothetical protein
MKSKLLGYRTLPCHNCGVETELDDVFCQECGSKLIEQPAKLSTVAILSNAFTMLFRSSHSWKSREFENESLPPSAGSVEAKTASLADREPERKAEIISPEMINASPTGPQAFWTSLPRLSTAQIVLPTVIIGFLAVTWAVHAIENSFDSLSEDFIAEAATKGLRQNQAGQSAELLLRAYMERNGKLTKAHIELLGRCLLRSATECMQTGRIDKAEQNLRDVPKECTSYVAAQARMQELALLKANTGSSPTGGHDAKCVAAHAIETLPTKAINPAKQPHAFAVSPSAVSPMVAPLVSSTRPSAPIALSAGNKTLQEDQAPSASEKSSPLPLPSNGNKALTPRALQGSPSPGSSLARAPKMQQPSSGFFIDGVEISPQSERTQSAAKLETPTAQNKKKQTAQMLAAKVPSSDTGASGTPPKPPKHQGSDEPGQSAAADAWPTVESHKATPAAADKSGSQRVAMPPQGETHHGAGRGAVSDTQSAPSYDSEEISKYNELLVRYFGKRRGSALSSESEAGQEPPSLQEWIDKGKPDFR